MVTRSPCCLHVIIAGYLLVVAIFLQGRHDVAVVQAFSLLQHPASSYYDLLPTSATISTSRSSKMSSVGTISVGFKCATTRRTPERVSRVVLGEPRLLLLLQLTKSDEDDDVEARGTAPGMKDAFRQLEALKSIGDLDSNESSSKDESSSAFTKSMITTPIQPPSETTVPLAETASPEQQIQVYTEMVKELEQQDQEDLYSDILAGMGVGDPTTIASKSKTLLSSLSGEYNSVASSSSLLETSDTEEFMNQALQEALQEAATNRDKATAAGSSGSSMTESVLNDKEIMKEIELIFERGNDQLMESIEEMRAEQRELAKASAEDTAQSAMDNIDVNAQRLARAESSMVTMLERVNKETAAVEKAVQDLQQAQMDMSKKSSDPVAKLRQGGIPKQAALVGLLLFSFRSIADSIAAMGDSTGSGDMTAALIQGAIALACGVYLILL